MSKCLLIKSDRGGQLFIVNRTFTLQLKEYLIVLSRLDLLTAGQATRTLLRIIDAIRFDS